MYIHTHIHILLYIPLLVSGLGIAFCFAQADKPAGHPSLTPSQDLELETSIWFLPVQPQQCPVLCGCFPSSKMGWRQCQSEAVRQTGSHSFCSTEPHTVVVPPGFDPYHCLWGLHLGCLLELNRDTKGSSTGGCLNLLCVMDLWSFSKCL